MNFENILGRSDRRGRLPPSLSAPPSMRPWAVIGPHLVAVGAERDNGSGEDGAGRRDEVEMGRLRKEEEEARAEKNTFFTRLRPS